MHPVLLQIGPITLRWYGFMIAVSCMTGLWIAQKEAGRKQIDPENIKDFFVVALLASIAGARLYYIAFTGFSLFWENPASILAVWQGGMAIHGAILGGLLTAVFYTRRHKISFWKFADTLALTYPGTGPRPDWMFFERGCTRVSHRSSLGNDLQ